MKLKKWADFGNETYQRSFLGNSHRFYVRRDPATKKFMLTYAAYDETLPAPFPSRFDSMESVNAHVETMVRSFIAKMNEFLNQISSMDFVDVGGWQS